MNREEVGDNLLLLLFFRERLRTHKAVGKLSFGPDKVKDYINISVLCFHSFCTCTNDLRKTICACM